MNILLVEDEVLLRHHLSYQLKEEGHTTFEADTGESGLHFLRDYTPDVAVVDLGLPGFDGVHMIETARTEGITTPILVLTARGSWRDKVTSLNAGADDYLVKPFELEELKARLNALVRRSAGFSQPALQAGPYKIDMLSGQFFINDQPVSLTSFEFKFLELFLRSQNKVLSRAAIQDRLYGADHSPESNVLEVLINRLRKKLKGHSGLNPIVTVRGKGYRFELP
ncbi:response regulator [Endozoicomonadaceae bacterium StTr2]